MCRFFTTFELRMWTGLPVDVAFIFYSSSWIGGIGLEASFSRVPKNV